MDHELRLDDDLTLHSAVSRAAFLTTRKRIGARRLCGKFQRLGQILFQFQAVIAICERQSRRRIRLASLRERIDVDSMRSIDRRQF